jgi:hypothetical protein
MVKFQLIAAALAACQLGAASAAKSTPRQRAKALLKKLTYEEKIAQMGGIRRLLKSGGIVDEDNYNSRYQTQNGNIGKKCLDMFTSRSAYLHDV